MSIIISFVPVPSILSSSPSPQLYVQAYSTRGPNQRDLGNPVRISLRRGKHNSKERSLIPLTCDPKERVENIRNVTGSIGNPAVLSVLKGIVSWNLEP
jgi:hypothetical protein